MSGLAGATAAALVAIAISGVLGCGQDESPAPREPARPAREDAVATTWPALPRSATEAAELIGRRTRRAPHPARTVDAPGLEGAVRDGLKRGDAVAGWPEIGRWVSRRLEAAGEQDRWVVFGTTHDSEAQVTAFRRLFGGSAQGLSSVVMATELFRAEGRWGGVPRTAQRGDDGALREYLATGAPETWEALRTAQVEESYTAWKYDYLPSVMDQLLEARAAGQAFRGCDMPRATQSLLSRVQEEQRLRLRELHCVLSIDDAVAPPRRVAVMTGDAHAWADGMRRFLPPQRAAVAIHAFGGRPGDHAPERALGGQIRFTDPILAPVSPSDHLLVVPDEHTAARRERRRDRLDAALGPAERHVVTARAEPACALHIGAAGPVALGDDETRIPLAPGSHPFLCERDGRDLAGVVRMPESGALEVVWRADEVDILVRVPAQAPP